MTLTPLMENAITAALSAGTQIMNIYTDPAADFDIQTKKDNTPLTRADRAAHRTIVNILEKTHIDILSEEGTHDTYPHRQHLTHLWIVDPLDGTKEFIKRNGEFTVNIALIQHRTPILGVVYAPARHTLWFARQDQGSFLVDVPNDCTQAHRLPASRKLPLPTTTPRPYTVVCSRSHIDPQTQQYIQNLRQQHPDLTTLSCGSSLKICRVAEGTADIYPRFGPTMEWDTAAAHAVALYAGRNILDAQTLTPLIYNKPDLHNPHFIVK